MVSRGKALCQGLGWELPLGGGLCPGSLLGLQVIVAEGSWIFHNNKYRFQGTHPMPAAC